MEEEVSQTESEETVMGCTETNRPEGPTEGLTVRMFTPFRRQNKPCSSPLRVDILVFAEQSIQTRQSCGAGRPVWTLHTMCPVSGLIWGRSLGQEDWSGWGQDPDRMMPGLTALQRLQRVKPGLIILSMESRIKVIIIIKILILK